MNFLTFLQTFRRGQLVSEGDDRLHELIEAIGETSGSGSLTLKIDFKTNKAGQLETTPTITIKKPSKSIGTGIYWPTIDGLLSRSDPNQADIEDYIGARSGTDE
ncbi:hypothetical protein FHY64_06575 [Pelagovum pacificum]|uniref:Uncharacterized protein n=2 Tax=Pelagovum pacificum TaxID=2588711 RepID=A0A5C5GJI7_9RHOB|nr:hypothetical protein I8N54_04975 [Pelagovum pacificum]TNY34334.1 hypothetical protein FHY64_06575 [Pelagovum pacificum]